MAEEVANEERQIPMEETAGASITPAPLAPSKPIPMRERSWMVFAIPASFAIFINAMIFLFLLYRGGIPFFAAYSPISFFFGSTWDVGTGQYGFLPMVFGTFVVVVVAIAIAIPLSLGTAIFISEIAPGHIRSTIKVIVELLAGVPSIVYAVIGMRYLIKYLPPIFGWLSGWNGVTAGIVLSIMITPIIVTLTDDALRGVPKDLKDCAYALGSTKWQVIHKVSLPLASPGIFSAIVLALSRALGETVVVLLLSGNTPHIPVPWWDWSQAIRPITANIIAEMGDAPFGSVTYEALITCGLILFGITYGFNYVSSVFQKRMMKKYTGFKAS